MTGSDLTHLVAGALFAAVALGWVLHWFWCLIARATSTERERIASLMTQLDVAETDREMLTAEIAQLKTAHLARLGELERNITTMASEHAAEVEQRVGAVMREAEVARSEATDAWGALADARRRIGELEQAVAAERRAANPGPGDEEAP